MSELHQRCRFYPNCRIHLGVPPPRRFSEDNQQEMAELFRQGWQYTEIAAYFGTDPNTISRTVIKKRAPFG